MTPRPLLVWALPWVFPVKTPACGHLCASSLHGGDGTGCARVPNSRTQPGAEILGAGIPEVGTPAAGIAERDLLGSRDPRNQDAGGEDARSRVPGTGMPQEEISGAGSQEWGRFCGPRTPPLPVSRWLRRPGIPWSGEPQGMRRCSQGRGAGRGSPVLAGSVIGGVSEQPCRGGLQCRPAQISFYFVLFRFIRAGAAGPGRPGQRESTHPRGTVPGRGGCRGPGRGVPHPGGVSSARGRASPARPLPRPPRAPRDSRLR